MNNMKITIDDIKAVLKLVKQDYAKTSYGLTWTDDKPLDYYKYNQDTND